MREPSVRGTARPTESPLHLIICLRGPGGSPGPRMRLSQDAQFGRLKHPSYRIGNARRRLVPRMALVNRRNLVQALHLAHCLQDR